MKAMWCTEGSFPSLQAHCCALSRECSCVMNRLSGQPKALCAHVSVDKVQERPMMLLPLAKHLFPHMLLSTE